MATKKKKFKMSPHQIKLLLWGILGVVIALPYFGMWYFKKHYEDKEKSLERAAMVIIDKQDMTIQVIDHHSKPLFKSGIACGQNYGNKLAKGDMRTPEGTFFVSDIQDASSWTHDFGDGNGEIKNAYGPYFFRLHTPGHKGIGIHGTHDPNSIGTRATEGCIRLKNEELLKFHEVAYVGMPVVILPAIDDQSANAASAK